MSSLSVSAGARAICGDTSSAAVLDMLLERRIKHSDSTKSKIKLRTIGNEVCLEESGAIDLVRRLASKGLVCIDESECDLAEGVLLEVTGLRLVVACRPADQPQLLDDGEDLDREVIPVVVKDPRKVEPFIDEVTDSDGTVWAGRARPVYMNGDTDYIVKVIFDVRRKLTVEEQPVEVVQGREFETLQMAWEWFDELTGGGLILPWAARQAIDNPADFVAVDDETLEALATVLGVSPSGDSLRVDTVAGSMVFMARDGGKRWPGLDVPVTTKQKRAARKKAKEEATEPLAEAGATTPETDEATG